MKGKIFLAWQSQESDISRFVKKHLNKSKKYLLRTKQLDLDIIFAPTQDESGSPDIIEKIWSQIADSDVFIGDISHIAVLGNGSQVSNSNVMYEAGLALALLGEARTILLASKASDIDKLAFDINHKRISSFDIKNENFYIELSDWISSAMIDATNQRFYKKYLVKDILDEMEILFNNLLRLVYGTETLEYPPNFQTVCIEEICKNLKHNVFDVFQVKTDYSEMISNIEKNINLLYPSGDRFLIYNAIKLIDSLKEYQAINELSNYNQFECLGIVRDCIYTFMDCKSFRLESIKNYSELESGLYFRKDVMLLSKISPALPHINVFKKAGISLALQECETKVELNMTIGLVTKYKFKAEASVEEYAQRIYIMLETMNNILDHLKLEVCSQIKQTGVIKGLIHFYNCKV
ncbi:MAG: hypothetical protein ACYCVD_14670 [Desulfitobacteriaceae bacterium]